MKLFTLTATAATAAMMLSLGISSAEAHPRLWPHSHATRVVVEKQVVVKPAPVRTAVARALVGATFDTIPANHVRVVHAGRTYFVHDGVYHVRNAGRYTVVKPVAGVRITTLPRGYSTVRISGRTHYRFNNVTYRRVNNYYVVV
jgi:hypothetical protein